MKKMYLAIDFKYMDVAFMYLENSSIYALITMNKIISVHVGYLVAVD
jgi:hypothetical protein